MRAPVIAANWKMHKTRAEATAFTQKLVARLTPLPDWIATAERPGVEAILAPPFPLLESVAREAAGAPLALAAQNLHPAEQGAFTGEVSGAMLADLGCGYVILGHSERRALFQESSEWIAEKVAAALHHQLRPILCVGETLEQREADETEVILAEQLEGSLAKLDPALAERLVLAYEPVWAIGTGRTATPELAQEAHAFLRGCLNRRFGAVADRIRIQYGGSVKPDNAESLLRQPDIDGALVGGASLDPDSFFDILRAGAASLEE